MIGKSFKPKITKVEMFMFGKGRGLLFDYNEHIAISITVKAIREKEFTFHVYDEGTRLGYYPFDKKENILKLIDERYDSNLVKSYDTVLNMLNRTGKDRLNEIRDSIYELHKKILQDKDSIVSIKDYRENKK